jgi:hypothetical protein
LPNIKVYEGRVEGREEGGGRKRRQKYEEEESGS